MRPVKTFIPIVALIASVSAGGCVSDAAGLASRLKWTLTSRGVAFRTMDQVYPFRVIARGGRVMPLPHAPRQLAVTYQFQGQSDSLDNLLSRTRTQGFLVIKGGSIIDERYFAGADDKSRFTSWSVAKSFTSTLVGLALADGKIDNLNSPVTTYLPELQGSAYDGVSIKNVLEMSSGVQYRKTPTIRLDIGCGDTMDAESETLPTMSVD